jgi:hypothetical protein
MRAVYLISAFLLLTASFHSAAQQAGGDKVLEQQLTVQERAEYQKRLGRAGGEQERKDINAQYRKLVEDRSHAPGAGITAQPKAGPAGGPGHASPAANDSGPAGSKNKPQKSGH